MSLELCDVVLSISGRVLVNQVSLSLQPGEIVGLLGPNGAGKTTTFSLVTGLLRPDSGVVLFDDFDIGALSKPEGRGDTIVIGSQDYYSNEIIAEAYAQALEAGGIKVQRDFRIGQREGYLPEIESGKIDLFPEYTGPLLQVWKSSSRVPQASYQ